MLLITYNNSGEQSSNIHKPKEEEPRRESESPEPAEFHVYFPFFSFFLQICSGFSMLSGLINLEVC